MGWNGSGQKGAAPVQPKVTTKKPSPVRGLVAGVVVVALAVVAYFAFFSGSEKPQAEKSDKGRGRIKEVTPARAPTNKVEVAKKKYNVEVKKLPDGKLMKYVNGKQAWLYPRIEDKYGVVTSSLDRTSESIHTRIFHTVADRHLAFLLMHEPGDEFGDGLQTKGFTQLFLKSLTEPIIVSKDDTEEEKELKRAVIETKIDLKARYDAGEDIEHTIEDTIKTYQELGQYKSEIKKEIDKLSRDPAVTKEEMQQFVDAANEMLKKKGISAARVPGGIWKRIERNQKKMMFQNPKQ